MGLGRIAYLGCSPYEEPISGWDGRSKLFDEVLNVAFVNEPKMVIASVLDGQLYRYYNGNGVGSPYAARFDSVGANNPFETELPPTGYVLGILSLYFLAVVPLNFVVLRKLKRGELAWLTAPVLSLGFAGVFFGFARNLYGSSLSTFTRGVLVVQQGCKDTVVLGHTQLFFPAAGRYDLHLAGVDSVSTSLTGPYFTGSGDNQAIYQDIDTVDNGEIKGAIKVPSLAFRELNYREKAQAGDWFDVQRLSNGDFLVTNNSPYKLSRAQLAGGGGSVLVQDLAPGDHREVAFTNPASTPDFAGRLGSDLLRTKGLALTGTLKGFHPGPSIGSEVSGDGITLAFMTTQPLRESEIRRDLVHGGSY